MAFFFVYIGMAWLGVAWFVDLLSWHGMYGLVVLVIPFVVV